MKIRQYGDLKKAFVMRYSKRLELFEKIRSEYAGLLTSILWKLTGDTELFEEAFQYALLGIWKNIEKLTGPGAGAYIYRIALSANSKAWRKRIGSNGHITKEQPAGNSTDGVSFDKETLNLVRKQIAKLPERQARAILMRYIDQRNYGSIAEEMNCTEDTARSHVSKALASLRDKLARFNKPEY